MIRKARLEDLAHLAAVERSAGTRFQGTHLESAGEHTLPAEKLRAALLQGLLWVATDRDEMPVGFACTHLTADGLFIEELSVARPHQSQGHGRALLDAALAEARLRRLPALTLTTDRGLSWNAPFYARYGFELLAEQDWTPAMRAQIALETLHGLDPAHRCAMRITL